MTLPNNKLKVLQVVGRMNRGGAEVMLMDLYRNLSDDISFDFLINYKVNQGITIGDFDSEIESLGGSIKYIGTQWDIGPIKYINEFKRIIKEVGKPDVVHIHLNAKSGIIALAARLSGINKIIVHSHGMLKTDFMSIKLSLISFELIFQRMLINLFATDYWACSEQAFKSLFYKLNLKKDKKQLINNAVDVNKFICVDESDILIAKKSYGDESFVIGVVGRIVKSKNLMFVIEILKVLNGLKFDFICVVVGRVDDCNYMKEVEKKIQSYQLQEKVKFIGLSDDIPLVMSTFDLFISPSEREAFGMVAAEAQAAGLPCLLSNNFPDSIDMKLGLVTFLNILDPNEWAENIINLNSKRIVCKDLILNTFKELGFDVNNNILKVENVYRSNDL